MAITERYAIKKGPSSTGSGPHQLWIILLGRRRRSLIGLALHGTNPMILSERSLVGGLEEAGGFSALENVG